MYIKLKKQRNVQQTLINQIQVRPVVHNALQDTVLLPVLHHLLTVKLFAHLQNKKHIIGMKLRMF